MTGLAAPLAGVASLGAAGLVSVSTSQRSFEPLQISKSESRFTRLQKNLGIASKLQMLDQHGKRQNVVMTTLTYKNGDDWKPNHLNLYLSNIRDWYKRKIGQSLRYVWVAETQQRGAIHYHCVFWLAKGVTMPKADKRGWWPHGMTNTIKAIKPVGYLMSYVKKLTSKSSIPKGARIYGVGGLDATCRRIRTWANWPSFIQARADSKEHYARQTGGGWVNRVTGEWWPSEYGLMFTTRGTTVLKRLHDHGRPLQNVRGPFSWNPHMTQPL